MVIINRKKTNKKAFTLIELLGVIILLSVISIIAIVAVSKNINDTRSTLYTIQKNNIIDGAKNWSTDNVKELPESGDIYISLAQLKQGGYIEDNIKSPNNDNMCFPNTLEIKITSTTDGKYEYSIPMDSNEITYIACDSELLDTDRPTIILYKDSNSTINDKNEVVDYVEVDKNNHSYQVLGYSFNDIHGDKINIDDHDGYIISINVYKISNNNSQELIPDSLDNILLDISDYNVKYKIVYKIYEEGKDQKAVSAVRNVIIRDTTAPVITIAGIKDEETDEYVTTTKYIYNDAPISNWCDNIQISDNSNDDLIIKKSGDCAIDITTPCEKKVIVEASDKSNNKSKKGYKFIFKRQKQAGATIAVSPSSGDFIKNRNVIITSSDTSLESSNYQYYLSSNANSLEDGTWTNYTSGTEFSIGTNLTGTYYLFVKKITNDDGNVSTGVDSISDDSGEYHVFGPYSFDNIVPTLSLSVANGTTYSKSKTANVTIQDTGGSGLPNTGVKIYYGWGTSAISCSNMTNYITITPNAGETSATGNITINTGTGDGKLYICNKDAAIYDRAGNSIASETTMNADMYLDNDSPIIADNGSGNDILVEATENEYKFSFGMFINNNSTDFISNCVIKENNKDVRDHTKRLHKFQLLDDDNAISGNYITVISMDGFGDEVTSCPNIGPFKDCIKKDGSTAAYHYYYVRHPSVVFKTIYNFNTIEIFPSYAGRTGCTKFGYQDFQFNLNEKYDEGKNCVIAHGKQSDCKYNKATSCNANGSNDTSISYSCPTTKKNSKEPTHKGTNVTVDAEGISSKTFTVNFQDNESGILDGESSKSCTTSDDNTCEITISDNVGNTKVYTCSAATDTCM